MEKSNKSNLVVLLYTEALEYVQNKLNSLEKGQIKQLCKENKLTYQTVINLKNGYFKKELPQLVIKLLKALGYTHEVEFKSIFIFTIPEGKSPKVAKELANASTHKLRKK